MIHTPRPTHPTRQDEIRQANGALFAPVKNANQAEAQREARIERFVSKLDDVGCEAMDSHLEDTQGLRP